MRSLLLAAALASTLVVLASSGDSTAVTSAPHGVATKAAANELIQRQPGVFVPNLGQWEHRARFVHRSGPMTVFLVYDANGKFYMASNAVPLRLR